MLPLHVPRKQLDDVSPRAVLSPTQICRDTASYQITSTQVPSLSTLSARSNEEQQDVPLCSSAVHSDGTCRAIGESQHATRRHCARLSTGCRECDLAPYITRLAIPHRLSVRLSTRPIEPDNQRVLIVTNRDDNTQSRFGFLSTFSRKVALNLKGFRSSPSQAASH